MTVPPPRGPQRQINRWGLFALSFGSIVGSGWLVVLGEWLRAAGPAGAALGFAAGGVVMLAVAACYRELIARMPQVGGEFVFVLQTFGRLPAFVIGWALTLDFVAFAAFEGIALALLLQQLFPALTLHTLYTAFGRPVSFESLLIGVIGVIGFAALNLAGTRGSVRFQTIITFGFILFAILLIAIGVRFGSPANLVPAFGALDGDWRIGALWIFSTTVLFLNGFQSSAYAVEERSSTLAVSAVGQAMMRSVAVAALFYILSLVAASLVSPWRTSATSPLPTVAAFAGISPALGTAIIVAAALSLLKTWNGMVIIGSRMLIAQARAGLLPPALGVFDERGAPRAAILFCSISSLLGLFLGLGGLVPILNTCAICVALAYVLVIAALIRQRALRPSTAADCPVPGGRVTIAIALVSTTIMAATAAISPFFRSSRVIPLEWSLLIVWCALGFGLLFVTNRIVRRGQSNPSRGE